MAAILTGCLPNRVTIDLAPRDGELAESVVDDDGQSGFGTSHKVALIDLTGLISEQPTGAIVASNSSVVDRFVAHLAHAESDDRVQAVIVRINSPGGTASASETIAEEIDRFRARTGRPIIASLGEVAASGGYFAAMACDTIVAQPSTITGSIGVIIQTFNLSRGMSMIGVEGRAVTSRANKDIANPFEEPDEAHYEILQGMVDEMYDSFRSRVLSARAIEASKVELVTDGRVFTGASALEHGLVDELGGVREAFVIAKESAGISRARLVKYHREGDTLMTPYARSGSVDPPIDGDSPVGFVRENLRPGAYYLWTAGAVR